VVIAMRPPARLASSALLGLAIFACPVLGASAADEQRVVELFTSQGCSSCPAADRLMEKVAREPGTIVLTLPVDYWDYIGWKDTFATPAFTARQKAYAMARGDGHVYTPQVVIDGLRHAVGSDPLEIDDASKLAHGEKGAMGVTLRAHRENGRLLVDVGAAPDGAGKWGAFWVVHVAKARTVKIGRGENAGKTVTYTNVVRGMDKVGNWSGDAARYEIEEDGLKSPDAETYVLMLQASSGGKPGAILAAMKGEGF
jgi:hypothetical protein